MKKWRLLLTLREFVVALFHGRYASRQKSSYGLGVEGAHPFDFDDNFASFDFLRYIITGEEYALEKRSDRTARIYIFLDGTPSMKIGWGRRTRYEAQTDLASLFIEGLADEGNQIGIGMVTDRIEFLPLLKSGSRALRSELENALGKYPKGRLTDFRALHEFLFAGVPRGALVFVISDWESLTLSSELMGDIDERFELIPIVLLDRNERRDGWWPFGDTSTTDSETGERAVCGVVSNDYRHRAVFEQAGIDAIELDVENDEETWKVAVQEFFEERRKLRLQRRRR